MLKRYIWLAVATVFFTFQMWVGNANALELTEELRTLPLNEQGDQVVLSLKEIRRGKAVFNDSCAQCHALGVTKTNPDVNLSPQSLAFATPPRDNIEAMVDYLKNPTTYDGFVEISEIHPSLKSADIYPEMRNITEDDLYDVSGYILLQPKVRGEQWGGGKYLR